MVRTQTRIVVVIGMANASVAAIAGLGGCLFPSLDEMLGPGEAPASKDDDRDAGAKPSASTPDGASDSEIDPGGSSEAGATENDAASGAGVVACGSETCSLKTSYCCVSFGSGGCNDNDELPICQSIVRCDGAQDCTGGRVCCVSEFSNESTCASRCEDGSRVICQPDSPICPTGMSCTGRQDLGGIVGAFCR